MAASWMHARAVFELARDKLLAALGDAAITNTRRGNFVPDLERMKVTVDDISVSLMMDTERQPVRGRLEFQTWLQKLEDVAYEICDITDLVGTAPMARMLPVFTVRDNKIKAINELLQVLKQVLEEFGFCWQSFGQQRYDERTTTSLIDKATIVGRDEQVQRILDFLLPPEGMSDGREWPVVLPIFGLACVGKTTLAALVYNHTRFQDYARAWVHVSPSIDLRRIGKSIVECLTNATYYEDEDSNVMDLNSIKRRLHQLVGYGKKMLVVLDGIWEQDQQELDRLKSLLGVGKQGSKLVVIVTTHDEGIARRICTNKVQPYKLHPLSDDQCWAVFKQASRFEDRNDKQELDKIGREIVATKCGGLPLAAQALGDFLLGKTSEEWLAFASTDDRDYISIHDDFPEPMRTLFSSTLGLSYQSMPLNFRLCFAYLGTLREWHNMAGDDIINRWIALGLIEPTTNGVSTGQQIISRLLDFSFLRHSNLASTSGKHNDKGLVSFTMHSLIHYFARSLMSSTLLVADDGLTTIRPRHCRYAVLTNFVIGSSKLSDIFPFPSYIRSLSLLGCKIELSNDSFSFAKYLQVLELREPSMQKLPDSLCQLGLLGYLNLSGCSDLVQLPESFGNLTTVLHINLSGCSGLVQLPESFGRLTSALHINLSGCSGLVQLPESFGQLTSALHINLSGCSGLVQLPESFGKLTSVLHINLSGCSGLVKLPESFVNLTRVVHINLSGCHGLDDLPKSFCKLSNLEYLDLSFCSCPNELPRALDGLINLRHLNLSHPSCYAVEHIDHLEQIKDIWAKLKKLQYLNLSMFTNPIFCNLPEGQSSLDCFQSIFKGLSSLEHLDLSHNIFLVDLPETLCDVSRLHTLNLSGCRRLKRIAKKIAEMKCTIVLRKCPSLESYSFVVHADDGAHGSNLVQLEDIVSCKELEISCLEKVKSVEEAKRITLKVKKLEKLTLGWTVDRHVSSVDDEALLAELVPPQNLQSLALKGYGGNGLPSWLTSDLCLHLPNLERVTIENIPKCHTIPPLLLLPKLKQVVLRKMASITKVDAGEMSGGNRAQFHRLVQLTLDDMENLQEFNTIYRSGFEYFMFPTIDELVIQNCRKLKFRPLLPMAQRLQVSACDQVMSSWPKREAGNQGKGLEASSSSTSASAARLVVENCMVPLGEWCLLYHLPGLQSLEIRGCNDLTFSPEIIQALSSLQSLCFYQCNAMTSLPEYLSDLSTLQELTINSCQDIESLPDSVAKLRNLKDLCIPGCPKLHEWLKSEDNKKKFAHIQIRESATVEPGTTANETTNNKQLTRGRSSLLVTSD